MSLTDPFLAEDFSGGGLFLLWLWLNLPYIAIGVVICIVIYAIFPRPKTRPQSRPFDPGNVVERLTEIEGKSLPADADEPLNRPSQPQGYNRALHERRISAKSSFASAVRGLVFATAAVAAVTAPLWLGTAFEESPVSFALAIGAVGGALLIGKLVRAANRRHDPRLQRPPANDP